MPEVDKSTYEKAARLAYDVLRGRDGEQLLAYLYNTAMSPLGQDASPHAVMHREGQRFVVAHIQTLFNDGQKLREKEMRNDSDGKPAVAKRTSARTRGKRK